MIIVMTTIINNNNTNNNSNTNNISNQNQSKKKKKKRVSKTWDLPVAGLTPNMDKGPTMDSYCSYFNILLFDNRTDIADVNEPSKHEWVFDGF